MHVTFHVPDLVWLVEIIENENVVWCFELLEISISQIESNALENPFGETAVSP